jgi:transcription initiation factor TFIIIB Brf1 subunit/transcription initiation factor TFIIB
MSDEKPKRPGCLKCHGARITIVVHESLKEATIDCAICGSYVAYRFVDKKKKIKWETAEQRQERTRRTHICQRCEEKFYDYFGGDSNAGSVRPKTCIPCSQDETMVGEEILRENMARKNNKNTPWRIYTKPGGIGKNIR